MYRGRNLALGLALALSAQIPSSSLARARRPAAKQPPAATAPAPAAQSAPAPAPASPPPDAIAPAAGSAPSEGAVPPAAAPAAPAAPATPTAPATPATPATPAAPTAPTAAPAPAAAPAEAVHGPPAPTDKTAESTASPLPTESATEPTARVYTQAKAACREVKEGRIAAGVAQLAEAVAQAESLGLLVTDRAAIRYLYALALERAGEDRSALAQLQKARTEDPRSAEITQEIAVVQVELREYQEAIRTAQRSLDLGLDAEDAKEARELMRRARAELLHTRLRVEANLEVGFDSNLLQGEDYETIGGKSSRGAARFQAARLGSIQPFRTLSEDPARGTQVYQRTITADYQTAAPVLTQAGLPLNLSLAVAGHPLTFRGVELWLGYRFAQTFLLFAQTDPSGRLPDQDLYHRQEHAATVDLWARPRPWLALSGRLEGFVNLSGLQNYTPFQGGLLARASGTLTESPRWNTRATLAYQFCRSFDQDNDGYLNGNQLQLKLTQELRLGWVRPQLSYRFVYDATGVLQVESPLGVMYTPSSNPTVMPIAATLGSYTYLAPLTHHGHQFSLSAAFILPRGIEAFGALRYEYVGYPDPYSATYTGNAVGVIPILPSFPLPGLQRTDHRITVEGSVRKELPHRLAVQLDYSFVGNFSSIANAADNRSYTKHTALASVSYYY